SEEGVEGALIQQLVREGEQVIVQVVKDPLGTKGARLTTQLSIPSRFLVYLPGSDHLGISQRIDSNEERDRLREVIADHSQNLKGGFIVRTAAEGVSGEILSKDIEFLGRLWGEIEERVASASDIELIHEDMQVVMRTMRDIASVDIEKIRIDSRETFVKVESFTSKLIPEIADRIVHYTGERPLFDLYGVEDEIHKALERKVQLKSGGYLIFDQTEAMTTIDVNTGGFVGHRNLEETIFKTNLEAAQSIARQLRLRNLGGIIIIDFIDMDEEDHRRQVLRALERALEKDNAKAYISEVSALGLVQMTRKRTRESLEHVLCECCPTCGGRGTIKTAETVCFEIYREITREARAYDTEQLLVLASQEVVDLLLDEQSTSVAELESFVGREIRFQVESLYTQEQYDVVLI
ncbi:MAG: ribonuclease G, partial [Gammaproteobacteria bacterium]|nr:ribonuclease G [Gammaproteobacteria bacterium]